MNTLRRMALLICMILPLSISFLYAQGPDGSEYPLAKGDFFAYFLGPDEPADQIDAPKKGACPVSYVYEGDASSGSWQCGTALSCVSPTVPTLCQPTESSVKAYNLVHRTESSILKYGSSPGTLYW